MSGLFYNLGKLAGPKLRKAKWVYLAATAPEAEVIAAEHAVGHDMARQIKKHCKTCPDISQWLTDLAKPLISSLRNNTRTFSYEGIYAPQPQAFCLPGGFIFVSDSMIQRCGSDTNQLAFILAHEMAHVIEGHVMERMLTSALIKTAFRSGHLSAAATDSLWKLGTRFLEQAYSQENEIRADTFAVRLIHAAGYHPAGAIDLFLHLEPLQADHRLGRYFSTHPSCKIRIQNVKNLLRGILP